MIQNETIHDRIRMLIDKYGDGKNTTFATLIGSNEGSIRGYLRGVMPKQDILERIVRTLDVDARWLLTGEGSMIKGVAREEREEKEETKRELSIYNLKTDYYETNKQRIPLYELSMAAGLEVLFSSQVTQVPLDYITIPNAPKCDGAMFVRGDSMYPVLKSGDIACYKHIESLDDIYYGEIYLLDMEVSGDQHLTTKYVQKSDLGDEYLKLVSHNSHHSSKDVHKSSIRALAIVKLSIRYHTLS